jgi:prepilin-type N-terminal cleavage/methylation domain-containing protein
MNRRSDPSHPASASGFTLVEVMVAVAILAIVILGFMATRSQAMADAIQAFNWRLARSIAEEQLSKLQAGANEFKPEPNAVDVEDYPGFRYVILIGDEAIARAEAEIESFSNGDDYEASERRQWQRDRGDLRSARQKGVSLDDYRREQVQSEYGEEQMPTEDDFEEVAVIVYFPNVTLDKDVDKLEETFTLKAKVSTLAVHGLTPEQAESMAAQRGDATPTGGSSGAAASGDNNAGK